MSLIRPLFCAYTMSTKITYNGNGQKNKHHLCLRAEPDGRISCVLTTLFGYGFLQYVQIISDFHEQKSLPKPAGRGVLNKNNRFLCEMNRGIIANQEEKQSVFERLCQTRS